MADALAHVVLGKHHAGGSDALEDATVAHRGRLRPDAVDAEVDQQRCRENARFQVRSDRYHRAVELLGADLPHGGLVRAVGFDDVGQLARPLLDPSRTHVDGEHLVTELRQGVSHRCAEAA